MPVTVRKGKTLIEHRPAETVAAGLGLGAAVAAAFSGDWQTFVVALIGFVPAVVTYLVEHGGVRGLVLSLWRGNSRS